MICSTLLLCTIASKDEKIGACHFKALCIQTSEGASSNSLQFLHTETEIFLCFKVLLRYNLHKINYMYLNYIIK